MSDTYVDLFGRVQTWQPKPKDKHGKAKQRANGYPKPPGSGPAGQTCQTCEYKTVIEIRSGRRFWKCLKFKSPLVERKWSGSISSDIRLKSPACSLWEPALSKTPHPPIG